MKNNYFALNWCKFGVYTNCWENLIPINVFYFNLKRISAFLEVFYSLLFPTYIQTYESYQKISMNIYTKKIIPKKILLGQVVEHSTPIEMVVVLGPGRVIFVWRSIKFALL